MTISKLNDLLEKLDIPIVKNMNITVNRLGSKGFLNLHEIARFAMNLKASIRNYEQDMVIQFILDTNILLQRNTFLLIVTIPREIMILPIWIFQMV